MSWNLSLITQSLRAENNTGPALQYVLSRAQDVFFITLSSWSSVRAAHTVEDLQQLNFNVAAFPINIFGSQFRQFCAHSGPDSGGRLSQLK